jgi:RNA polymerase sigma factor for flagellar operon FliA
MIKKTSLTESGFAQLVADKTPLVERIASNLSRRLPRSVERDDLVQDGLVGLIDAILRWTRETAGSHFDHYVAQRAQGAMLDGLRANDPGTRGLRKVMREAELAIQRLGHEMGRLPRDSEVAQALGVKVADYQRMLQDVQGYALISLEDLGGGSNAEDYLNYCAKSHVDPLRVLERAAVRQALLTAIQALPAQKQAVLRLYYEGELKMHEIGLVLKVSEARVSQLHALCIAHLRSAILTGEPPAGLLTPRTQVRK